MLTNDFAGELNLPPIEYQYPDGCYDNPFDIKASGKFFIDAGGFTYLSDSLESFSYKKLNEIAKVIPMGYKTIIVNERLTFIKDGQILQDGKEEPDNVGEKYFTGFEKKGYKISSNHKVYYPKYNEYCYDFSKNDGWGLADTTWKSKQEAIEHAINVSKENKNIDFLMVCKVVAAVSWH